MPTSHPCPGPADANSARARAAVLFAAAARSDIDAHARLRCLAAEQSLTSPQLIATPVPRELGPPADPRSLVRAALTVLGSLPLEQFAERDIRDAAQHGRRALRLMP